MNIRQLIFQLKEKGCRLHVNGANLTSHGEITAEEEQWVKKFSEEIVAELTNEGKEFWLSEFTELSLRCDFPPLDVEGKGKNDISTYSTKLNTNEFNSLSKLAKRSDRNFSKLLLTVWIVLLHRYTSQEKIPVVTNIFSENILSGSPVKVEINEETSFLNINEELDRTETLYKEHFFPGIKWLEDQMSDEYASQFNVSFIYEESGESENYLSDFLVLDLDLSLRVNKYSKGLKIELLSNLDYFNKNDLENMSNHFKNILKSMVQDDEMSVATCSMVSTKEKNSLKLYHGDKREYLFEKDLATLFEEQVRKKTNQIAVASGDENVDYVTLNRMSNYIGKLLIESGVTKGTPVGVYVDRSIHTYMALLGILKVGGIYVPLDASYPSDYISLITEDLKLEHFISKKSLSEVLPNQNVKIILADDIKLEKLSQYDKNLGIKVDSQALAVIMYTSGSTGVPKGVKHKQIQLINRFNWTWENYPFKNEDVMCQRTALNFMPSMWELLGGLLQGIPTVIIPDKVIADPNKLLEFIKQYQITYMMAVPSLLKMMFQSSLDAKQYLSSIRLCITAGEPLTVDTFNQFQDIFSNAILLNDLGSTETNGVLYFDSKEKQNVSKLPNFQTIANTEIYLLDKYLNQVPIGVIGDIYISGAPLALEYVNRPDLNKESFRTIPHVSTEKVLYRLGDRARFLSNGTIQLFGRIDHQVKVRGKRVEIGHIESVINKHSNVQESVVVAKKTKSNINQLYAYVVGKSEVNEEDLKIYLNKVLPDYMVPFRVEIIESIPKRPNGKIDLKELIDRKDSLTSSKNNQDFIIESLKGIVSEILEVARDSVNIEKKFYAVGFDSASIVEFSYQITKKVKTKIDVTELYDCNNLVELAQLIMQKGQNSFFPNKDNEPSSSIDELQEKVIKTESDKKLESVPQGKTDRLISTQIIYKDRDAVTEVMSCAASILEVDLKSVNINKKLYEVGFDSVSIVAFATLLSKTLDTEITATDLYNCPTLQDVVQLVDNEIPTKHLEVQGETIKDRDENLSFNNDTYHKNVLSVLKKHAADILQVETTDLDGKQSFEDLEFTSADFTKYIKDLNQHFKCSLTLAHFIEYGSLDSLATYITKIQKTDTGLFQERKEVTPTVSTIQEKEKVPRFGDKEDNLNLIQKDIAIIGYSGRFPEALDINQYWQNISEGISAIREVPKQRWNEEDYYDSNPQTPNKSYSKWGGFIPDVDKFDAQFFNISKHEAKLMDPQQRLCLEEAYRSLEHAGYSNRSLNSRNVGTYVGVRNGDYTTRILRNGINNSSFTLMGNDSAILSARLAYLLNLKGPTLAIDTACSSSLVAIHLACQSILNGEIEMAIAGGAHVISSSDLHVTSSKMGMLSPSGQCKTFDNEADGFVPGEAVGFVVIKELQKAIEDGDFIHAVIKGSGINQDGTTNGITAPSVESQADLIEKTLKKYKIDPETITMVEAHGTGTKLGDPIEVKALTNAFRKTTKNVQYSAIGSVKTNIGHAVAGAGIASLAKVILSLKHKKIPKSLNYATKNEHINFEDSPFYVSTETKEWMTDKSPRRASISSFGFSGTNCYMVVEEASQQEIKSRFRDPYYLITLSAENKTSLIQKVEDLYQWTRKEGHLYEMGDISYTLLRGRSFHSHRLSFIVSSQYDLENALIRILEGNYQDANFGELNQTTYGSFLEKEHSVKIFENMKNNIYSSTEEFKLNLSKLAAQFVQENDLEWDSLIENRGWGTVPLPVYPFLQESFWVDEPILEKSSNIEAPKKETIGKSSVITTINSNDVWVVEHQISNKKIVPAAMYIENVRKAIKEIYNQETFRIENLVWMKPIEVKDKVEIEVELMESGQLSTTFNIKVDDNIHATGRICIGTFNQTYKTLHNVFSNSVLTKDKANCYSKFNSRGIKYGDSFRLINSLHISEEFVLGDLDSSLSGSDATCLIDAVFQTAVGFSFDKNDPHPYMPFTIEEIKIYKDFQAGSKVLVSKDNSIEKMGMRKYHLSLLNSENLVVMEVNGFTQREFKAEAQQTTQQPVMFYKPDWQISNLNLDSNKLVSGTTLLIDIDNTISGYQIKYSSHYSKFNRLIIVKPGVSYKQVNANEFILDIGNKEDLDQLLSDTEHKNIENILYMSKASVHSDYDSSSIFNLFKCVQGLLAVGYQKAINFIYTYINTSALSQPQHEAISGFLRVLEKEYGGFKGEIVGIQNEECDKTEHEFLGILHQELTKYDSFNEVSYQKHNRLVKQFEKIDLETYAQSLSSKLKKNGVYIIAGGIGGLGQIFVEHLAKTLHAKIVLTGRRPYNNEVELALKQIRFYGGEGMYLQCDISDRLHVENLIHFTKNNFNKIDGIFQSAGVISDSLFRNKSIKEVDQVFKPKINGTLYLDELTKDEDLQCFVLFSSVSPIMGNIGQCDYAYANSFIDAFAHKREALRKQGKRFGKTLSINWPFWTDGGMKIDESKRDAIQKDLGLYDLEKEEGLKAFEIAMNLEYPQIVVIKGEEGKVNNLFKNKDVQKSAGNIQVAPVTEYVEGDLINLAQQILSNNELIDVKIDLTEYGLNSITITEFSSLVSNFYDIQIPPSVFFEYSTLNAISEYLCEQYYQVIENHYQDKVILHENLIEVAATNETEFDEVSHSEKFRDSDLKNEKNMEIAIVGLSAKFPGANSVEEFWRNLMAGKSAISMVPSKRWDLEKYYGDLNQDSKTPVNMGGFITDIDKFDPMFFGISPAEAKLMDPQQRILLQQVWKALEDSGHKPSLLSGEEVGVFIGTFTNDYNNLLIKEGINEGHTVAGNDHSIMANRISYTFNFKGPSEAIDTACSSSLVGLHRAVQSLKIGECKLAIVGGVNALLSPDGFIRATKAGMLTTDGQIRSFDEQANGYLRGEGCGVIVLKPMRAAIEDNDNIYAVIKGSAVNHSGKGYGLTTPSINGQAEVFIKALKDADISPESLSYIEAHGTASKLSDSIEIDAYKKVFKQFSDDLNNQHYCGIGSIKPNIGHLEAASGIASLMKAVLALRHKKVPPVINFETLNENIRLEGSPFYIVDQPQELRLKNKNIKDKNSTIKVGVHSFGFGGTNAHIILEEYVTNTESYNFNKAKHLIPFSAKTKRSMLTYLSTFRDWLNDNRGVSIEGLAHTLQTGREELSEKVIMIVTDIEDLINQCNDYIDGKEHSYIEGNTDKQKTDLAWILDRDIIEAITLKAIVEEDFTKIAKLWAAGYSIQWERLYESGNVTKISLPTYEFDNQSFWFKEISTFSKFEQNSHIHLETKKDHDSSNYKKSLDFSHYKSLVTDQIKQLIGIESIDLNTKLFDYGFDSIMAIKLKYLLEEELSIDIPLEVLGKSTTIEAIHSYLEEKIDPNSTKLDLPTKQEENSLNSQDDLTNADEETLIALFERMTTK